MDRQPAERTIAGFDQAWLEHGGYLRAIASRMLADPTEADDVVQDAFSRLAQIGLDELDDVRGWLVVVVRRICLDRLRSAHSRHEAPAADLPERGTAASADPADRVTLDDQIQLALAVVLDRLSPAERTAFVLHDVFGFSFAEIAEIVGRTPTACRQLASRARRSVRSGETSPQRSEAQIAGDRAALDRFVAVCSGGDIGGLVQLLDPAVDGGGTVFGGGDLPSVTGRPNIARMLVDLFGPDSERTLTVVPVEGAYALMAFDRGRATSVVKIETVDGLVVHMKAFVRLPG